MISKIRSAYARKLHTSRKRGATLMEMVAWLALAAMIIAGALVLWNVANGSRQTTQALTQLNQVQTAVRTLYNGQSNYLGLTTAALVTAKSVQQSMISGATIRHAYNGTVVVLPATTTNGGANSAFSIAFANIPQDACQQMLTKDLGRGVYSAGASVVAVQPNLPFNVASAATSCSAAYNTVTWVFN
jgi:Tfp pilus assembly protein PilE